MKSSNKKNSLGLLDRFFSIVERAPGSDRLFIKTLVILVIISAFWTFLALNQKYSYITPTAGGTITEGIVGTPRFVNPTLAVTRADRDVSALVYSGLMRIDTDGTLINDLAKEISLSDDGLVYTIDVRRDVKFHDGTPLTARDVVFTLGLVQNPDLKSPLRANWTGVSIEQTDEYQFTISLEETYTSFLENLTLGILPAHIWSSLPIEQIPFSQVNTEPVGSGPFAVATPVRGTSGVIEKYTLTAFRDGIYQPKVDMIVLKFFTSETDLLSALEKKTIDATTYLPADQITEQIKTDHQLIETPLPRIFAVFFNQNKSPALRDSAVRQALDISTNREELVSQVLKGYGIPSDSPIAKGTIAVELPGNATAESATGTASTTQSAKEILIAGNWKENDGGGWQKRIDGEDVTLEITLRTSNNPLFAELLASITEQWKKLGINVITEQFEQTSFIQSVIRPRAYQAVLFGIDTGRADDLYSFWHSSQQDDPGLNITQYANITVDRLLEQARSEEDPSTRRQLLNEVAEIITAERPAIFLFQPNLTYVVSKEVTIPSLVGVGQPHERFSNVHLWHTKKTALWPIFHQGEDVIYDQ